MGPPPAASQPLRRARLGIRGYLVLYAAGLGSMLLGGSVVHAVAQPDLVWFGAWRSFHRRAPLSLGALRPAACLHGLF